jgi:hypothetical protein
MTGQCLFKNAVRPNVGEVWTELYTAPVSKASLMLQLNGSVEGAADLVGSARIYRPSVGAYAYLIRQAPIPTGDTIKLIDKAKIVLMAGDVVQVRCDSPGESIDYVASVIEDINDEQTLGISLFTLGTYRSVVVGGVEDTWVKVIDAPGSKTSFALQINAANPTDSGIQVSARLYDASQNVYASLLDKGAVPVADALRLIDGSKVVLEPGDFIEVRCDSDGRTADFVSSFIEDVNQV